MWVYRNKELVHRKYVIAIAVKFIEVKMRSQVGRGKTIGGGGGAYS